MSLTFDRVPKFCSIFMLTASIYLHPSNLWAGGNLFFSNTPFGPGYVGQLLKTPQSYGATDYLIYYFSNSGKEVAKISGHVMPGEPAYFDMGAIKIMDKDLRGLKASPKMYRQLFDHIDMSALPDPFRVTTMYADTNQAAYLTRYGQLLSQGMAKEEAAKEAVKATAAYAVWGNRFGAEVLASTVEGDYITAELLVSHAGIFGSNTALGSTNTLGGVAYRGPGYEPLTGRPLSLDPYARPGQSLFAAERPHQRPRGGGNLALATTVLTLSIEGAGSGTRIIDIMNGRAPGSSFDFEINPEWGAFWWTLDKGRNGLANIGRTVDAFGEAYVPGFIGKPVGAVLNGAGALRQRAEFDFALSVGERQTIITSPPVTRQERQQQIMEREQRLDRLLRPWNYVDNYGGSSAPSPCELE